MAQLAATWFVYKDGSDYKRVNGLSGAVVTNTSFATIINGAINTVTALTDGGRIVLTGETTFTLASGEVINLKSKVTVEGQGHGTKISKSTSGDAISIIGTSGSEIVNWAVKNLRLSGPSLEATQVSGNGIYADYADKGLIENVDISGFSSGNNDGAIHTRRCQELTINRCRLHDSKNGWITGNSSGVTEYETMISTISNSYCYSNYDDGIHGQISSRLSIVNNQVYSNLESGIDLLGDENDIVAGNIVYDNGVTGIEVGNTTGMLNPDRYHTIVGNISRDNGDVGIGLLPRSEYCVVTGNISKQNADGIKINSSDTGSTLWHIVTSNLVEGNTGRGLYVVNGVNSYHYIAENTVRNNGNRGIYITSTTGTVLPSNNIVTLNRASGNRTNDILDNVASSTNKVFDNFSFVNSRWVKGPELSEQLAAFISMAHKINVPSTYADLEFLTLSATGTAHVAGGVGAVYETEMDFTGKTQVKAQWYHGRNGTGTQDLRVVDTAANVLFTVTGITTDGKKTVALTTLPSWATSLKTIKVQVQSSVTTDDPAITDMSIWLK